MKSKILFLFISIFGIIFYIYMSKFIIPESNFDFDISLNEAKSIAKKEISIMGYDTSELECIVKIKVNNKNSKYLFEKRDKLKINDKIGKYNASYFDLFLFSKKDFESVTMNRQNQMILGDKNKLSFEMYLDPKGKIIHYKKNILDSANLAEIDTSKIFDKLNLFIDKNYNEIKFKLSNTIWRFNKSELKVIYSGINSFGDTVDCEVKTSGNEISQVDFKYRFENNIKLEERSNEFISILKIIIWIIIFVLVIFSIIQRIKNDEINFKSAMIFGIILGVIYSIPYVLAIFEESPIFKLELVIVILFIPLFMSLMLIFIYASVDSMPRVFWNEKYYSFDALHKGYLNSVKVQKSFLNGFILSGILLLLNIIFYIIANAVFKYDLSGLPKDYDGTLNSYLKPTGIISILSGIISYSFLLPFIIVLSIALIRSKIKDNILLILLGTLILSFMDIPLGRKPTTESFIFVYNFIFYSAIILIFLKYDLLTLIFIFAICQLINILTFFLNNRSEYSEFNLYILVTIFLLILLFYFLSYLFKKEDKINYKEISPNFVKRITERERISKEIDAARHIQKSFLPCNTPNFPGLEIAANCIPAYEVGGDYFDYFILDENKLGITIADVSGKGVKAAFYMTLIKGIIKAQTQSYINPREVVSKLNKLLFEIVEKGNFISLIYGVFDIEKKIFIYSNAGHNPFIYKDTTTGKISFLEIGGMALGLTTQEIFDQNITENIIDFRPGDLFVFYTDGFTEAMNKSNDQFGEEAFLTLIGQTSSNSPDKILSITETEVKKYIGKAEQHDDMTLVVVRTK